MPAELFILGSGSATPTLSRNPSAQLLRLNQTDVLIDCGEGAQLQMLRFRLKPSRIRAIFISHMHGDHYLGLPGLISSMHLMGRKERLTVYGPPELWPILDEQFRVSETQLRFPLHFVAIEGDGLQCLTDIGGFQVFSFPLNHRIPCHGFLFRELPHRRHLLMDRVQQAQVPVQFYKALKDGEDYVSSQGERIANTWLTKASSAPVSYAYCSDTAPFEGLRAIVQDVDYLYHEATFLHELEGRARETFHTTAREAGALARQAGVRQHLYIGHFSSRYREIDALQAEAFAEFAKTTAVHDGDHFILAPLS
jgi:ribonuclease Z